MLGNHPRLFVMAATHVTHILPLHPSPRPSLSPFLHLFPPSSSSSFHRTGGVCAPYSAHNTYPAPYTSRVWGKFLNFARIENFHILFPRRRDAARCWLQPSCSRRSCRSLLMRQRCNRSEKFPKAMPLYPASSEIVSELAIEDNKRVGQFEPLPN